MFCAWCGSRIATVSYAPCPRCGKPTNGAQTAPPTTTGGGNAVVIVVALIVGGLIVIAIAGIVSAIAIPNLLTAMQRSKQKRTIAGIRSIAVAVEAYKTDNGSYPSATSIDALAPLISPKYISKVPPIDGWGHPLMYFCYEQQDGRCAGFVVGSAGKDGMFEHSEPRQYVESPQGATTNFNCDLIYANGEFIEYPEGIEH